MQNTHMQHNFNFNGQKLQFPRKAVIGIILIVALLAFELFNYDTTRYALENLLGDVQFVRVRWAAILAIAFCAIDFAGLVRLFTPEQGGNEPKEVWYLMGAWLLGATMNAVMTWWAISLTLLNHEFGNEVLGRGQLLHWVPIFVAVLVWLTRILFIGAFTVAGEHIFDFGNKNNSVPTAKPQLSAAPPQPLRADNGRSVPAGNGRSNSQPMPQPQRAPAPRPAMATKPQPTQPMYAATNDVPNFLEEYEPVPAPPTRTNTNPNNSRVRQRPPVPSVRRVPAAGVQAKGRQ